MWISKAWFEAMVSISSSDSVLDEILVSRGIDDVVLELMDELDPRRSRLALWRLGGDNLVDGLGELFAGLTAWSEIGLVFTGYAAGIGEHV